MEIFNCPNCGAPIPSYGWECQYCGTRFHNDAFKPVRLEVSHKKFEKIRGKVAVPNWMMCEHPTDAARFTIRELQNQMTEAVAALMKVKRCDDILRDQTIFQGEIDIAIPDMYWDQSL